MGGSTSCCIQKPGQDISSENLPETSKDGNEYPDPVASMVQVAEIQPEVVKSESADEATKIKEFLGQASLLSNMGTEDMQNLADALVKETFKEGTTIIKQGAVGDKFYLLEEGKCIVTKEVRGEPGEAKTVNNLTRGDAFGELALINDKPRAATVTASTDVTVLTLTQDKFRRLVGPMLDKDIDAMYGQVYQDELLLEVFFKGGGKQQSVLFRRRPLGMTLKNEFPLQVKKVEDRGHAFRVGVKSGWTMEKVGENDFTKTRQDGKAWDMETALKVFCDLLEPLPDTKKEGRRASARRSLMSGNIDL
mmetsp:Transcript_61150/g.112016  ORF Transcript_61150/g.112016 Transcript_61150/m.112016 type:complete len:306 (-) Transcript_61150:85-1002(-)